MNDCVLAQIPSFLFNNKVNLNLPFVESLLYGSLFLYVLITHLKYIDHSGGIYEQAGRS